MKIFECPENVLSPDIIKFLEEVETFDIDIEKNVSTMLSTIRAYGFEAVKNYTKKFDNFELTEQNIRVSKEEIDILAKKIDPQLSAYLEKAVERVKHFHSMQVEHGFDITDNEGNKMGQKVVPLESVAVYVPGGRALYPSTFYMTVIPALIAGVKRIVVLTPPRTFIESPEVARLIQILGIEEVYRGAGAALVLAAAYGKSGIAKVDKIVGPGNSYIAKAKQMCYGKIDIDMIAGPSDICVIADTHAEEDIPLIASDLLSQAEHDPHARAVLIATNRAFADKIKIELYKQTESLGESGKIAIESLNNKGMILVTTDRINAVKLANQIAPEHLELFSDDPYNLLDYVKYAGSVFLGKNTPESVGDYIGGPNHVLPTSGTSRFFSPLGVYDFTTRFSYLEFSRESLEKYKPVITGIARTEKFEAHARAVEKRFIEK